MNKKLYIRLFQHKDDVIPDNSEIIGTFEGLVSVPLAGDEVAYQISDWMTKHPDGKVDFVWLTNGI